MKDEILQTSLEQFLKYGIREVSIQKLVDPLEIKHGNPIGDISVQDDPPREVISTYLLGKKVQWKIYKTETGYFIASTNEKGDINASALSKSRNEIDILVSLISTLKQK